MGERFVAYQMENSEHIRAMDRHYYQNCTFQNNIHGNLELIYVSEGDVQTVIDGVEMTIPAGYFCLILPWQVHSFTTRSFSQAVILVFSPQYVQTFMRNMQGKAGKTQVFRADDEIHSLFLRYLYEGPFPDEYMTAAILLGVCHAFVRECPLVARYQNEKASGLYDAMYYISQHYSERLTLQDVAEQTGYSYYHLSHLFKEAAGMSFTQFLNMTRVGQAAERLQNTQEPITGIAFECGFATVRNFNRVFSEIMEMTPSEYRSCRMQSVQADRLPAIWGEQIQNVKER